MRQPLSLTDIIPLLKPQELRVLTQIAQRLYTGQTRYKPLDLANDTRDWLAETQEELVDALAYLEFMRVQRSMERE